MKTETMKLKQAMHYKARRDNDPKEGNWLRG